MGDDDTNSKIYVYDVNGVPRQTFTGQMNNPWGVDIDPTGIVYVADDQNKPTGWTSGIPATRCRPEPDPDPYGDTMLSIRR